MKNAILIFAAVILGQQLSAVSLVENAGGKTVSNDYYMLEISNSGAFKSLTFGGKKYIIYGSQEFRANGEQKVFTGQYSAAAPLVNSNNTKQKITVADRSENQVTIRCELKKPFMTSVISYVFDNSPVIQCRMDAAFKEAPSDWFYTLRLMNFSTENSAFMMPGKNVPAVPFDWAYYQPGAGWKFAFSKVHGGGIGFVTGTFCRGMEYYMNQRSLGFDNLTVIRIIPDPLRLLSGGKQASCTFSIIAGKMEERKVFETAGKLGSGKLSIHELGTEKLLCKPGEGNSVSAVIVNPSSRAVWADMELYLQTKLNSELPAGKRSIEIPAFSAVTFKMDFQTESGMRGGAACRLVCRKADGTSTEGVIPFAISDFPPESVRFAWVNSAMCHQDGSQQVWGDFLRRNKIGIIEYYLWMRSTIRGLAPKEDEWRPCTESPVYYKVLMKKSFIQDLVKKLKTCGVTVLSSVTGLYNYKEALKEPEQILYCENGQPSLYNGLIYQNKTRVATFKVHGYTKEFVDTWAKEMIASCRMFGWQGYRFDWYFIPDAPNDPLYLNTPSPDWRDMYGKTGKEYYPDPDKTAVERLTQYRSIMEKDNPDFIYATNIHANAKSEKRNPGYIKTASRKSLLIFEYMLGMTKKPRHTFRIWSETLAEDVQRVRVNGGQPAVGFARNFPSDSVSGNLIQYLCFAAGAKHAGTVVNVRDQYERDNFMTRFSEYYFSPDFLRIPEEERNGRFRLNTGYNIFFRPFICSRKLASGEREVTVHLINLPEEGEEICRYYPPVPARKGLELTAEPRKGEKMISAYAAVPQKSAAVPLEIEGNMVKLPELKDAMIVVLRYKNQ